MSLRILFADDSVTAQNMGKKILTEAGYEVVAVSNGAAAVKKIAEQKPDIIILDLYMPGYSGLEVCEKVRASIATIKTPVLLTVGKMEPYKPEDANRVRADGVIIKPFEASDLLTIVKKFEERISQMAAAPAPAAPPAAPPAEMSVAAPEFRPVEHPEPTTTRTLQPTVEVPDHMATASAFSDLLGSDAGHTPEPFNAAAPKPVPELQATPPPPPPPVSAAPPVTDHEVPVSRQPEPEPVAPVSPPEIPPPPPTEKIPIEEPPEAAPPRPRLIPVFQEPEAQKHDFIPTGAPPVPDLVITREPHLQETDEQTTRSTVADRREPDLLPARHQFEQPTAHTGRTVEFDLPQQVPPQATTPSPAPEVQNAPPEPAVEAPPVETQSTVATPAAPSVSDGDFEARVAAAMAAYDHPPEAATPAPSPAVEQNVGKAESVAPVRAEAPEVVPPPPPPPPVQYQQPASAPENHHQVQEPAPQKASEPVPPVTAEQEPSPQDASTVEHKEVSARIEEELPPAAVAAAKAAAEAGGDQQTIAQAVNRVMERVKGDLVDEILRELKSKK